jgi:hypothetical protein
VILVVVGHSGRECGGPEPGWSDTAILLEFLTGVAAGAAGLVALFRRRWIAALVAVPSGSAFQRLTRRRLRGSRRVSGTEAR